MPSLLLMIDRNGHELCRRELRNDIKPAIIEAFYHKIAAEAHVNSETSDIVIGNSTFVYACHEDLLLVAVLHHQTALATSLMLELLFEKLKIMHDHLGEHFTAEDVKTPEGLRIVEDVLHDRLNK